VYYPYELTMAGISDKAIKTNYSENKFRFNDATELQNKEFADGTGLEMDDAGFRTLDPQLGRFTQIDPIAGSSANFSTYAYGADNPFYFNDPIGLKAAPQNMSPADLSAWQKGIAGLGFGDIDGAANFDNLIAPVGGGSIDQILAANEYYSITPHLAQEFPGLPFIGLGFSKETEYHTTNSMGQQVLRIQITYDVLYQRNIGGVSGYPVLDVYSEIENSANGQVSSFPIYQNNSFIGTVTLDNYFTGQYNGRHGVFIKLTFNGCGQKNLNWVQRFSDSNPLDSKLKANQWYNDTDPPGSNPPYYYTPTELPQHLTSDGIWFSDFPSSKAPDTMTMQISLVTMGPNNLPNSTLITFQYGYTWQSGAATKQTFTQISK